MSYNWYSTRARRRGLLAAAATTIGLCLIGVSPILISGCGGGGGSSAPSGLGRAAQLVGTYKATQSVSGGQTQETNFDFTQGSAFETLRGSYTRRVLSPRPSGGSDYTSFSSGTLAGDILPNGDLHV